MTEEKEILRKKYKKIRDNISDRESKSIVICSNFLHSEIYKEANTILCYYPLKSEIDVKTILEIVLKSGKRLALPVCLDGGEMKFYYVKDLSLLKKGLFGINEPDPSQSLEVLDFDNSVCVVPGIAFDKRGYRIGYGGGYYDKFLEYFQGISIGLCYDELLKDSIPRDKHDRKVDFIITERIVEKTSNDL